MGIYLGLGSNVGDREAQLRFAVSALQEKGHRLWKSASLYWTQPRELEDQPWFLNTVVEVTDTAGARAADSGMPGDRKNGGRVYATYRRVRGPWTSISLFIRTESWNSRA